MTTHTPAQPMLTDDEILRTAINSSDSLNITRVHEIGGPSRTIMEDAGLLELARAIESALLSKLRAPVADERAAFEAWLGIKPCGSAHDFGWEAWRARAALASAPVADAQPVAYLHTSNRTLTWPGKLNEVQLASGVWRALYEHPPAPGHKPAPMDVSPGHSSPVAGDATGRTPTDYALEFAEYLARDAEYAMACLNASQRANEALLDLTEKVASSEAYQAAEEAAADADEAFTEAITGLQSAVFEFRKRRDRAALAATKGESNE